MPPASARDSGSLPLTFTLGVHARQLEDQFPAQDALRKRILNRFAKEKVEIPYPQQVAQLKTDKQP